MNPYFAEDNTFFFCFEMFRPSTGSLMTQCSQRDVRTLDSPTLCLQPRKQEQANCGKAQIDWNRQDWMMDELLLILTWDGMLSVGMTMGPQNGPHTLKVQRDGGRTM